MIDSDQVIAREVAADESGYVEHARAAFRSGWNVAIEYAAKKMAEGVEHLDDDECCHFQD